MSNIEGSISPEQGQGCAAAEQDVVARSPETSHIRSLSTRSARGLNTNTIL
jgi:hypothetical protein